MATVSEKAVKAAAQSAYVRSGWSAEWGDAGSNIRAEFMAGARQDLEAAVPLIRAEERERIKEAVRDELRSDSPTSELAGNLGEAIAGESGNYSLEFTTPEQVAEGICTWLDTRFFSENPETGEGR